jgi:phenylacetate-coenzyme A ligase PaaK-like adenylate-forming protein
MVDLISYRLAKLAQTLAFARDQSPYYQSLIPPGNISPEESPEILRSLPVLDAAAWDEIRLQVRTNSMNGAVLGFTNGTTGRPKPFYSNPSELNAVVDDTERDKRRCLNLIGLNHGAAASIGFNSSTMCVPLISPAYYDIAASIIARDGPAFEGPPIQLLTGPLRYIKELTLYMLERHGRIDGFGIECIEVGRNMLSPRWEQRLGSWWGAEIVPTYGFSEIRTCSARRCPTCSYYHLAISGVGEVVEVTDSDSYVPAGGRGALVVTAFHPYVQLEPRIRYRPGDVVELAPQACPQWGELGFRPLGRENHCYVIGSGSNIITPADCFAILADLPEVAASHDTHVVTGLDPRYHESGCPRFKLECNDNAVELHVELRFDPRLWDREAKSIEMAISSRLHDELTVVLHGHGQLRDLYFV